MKRYYNNTDKLDFRKTVWGYWNIYNSRTGTNNNKLTRLGTYNVKNTTTAQQLQEWWSELRKNNSFTLIEECPHLTCDACSTPSWYFIKDQQTSTTICLGPNRRGCGRSYRMSYEKQGQLYLNDDGKSNKGKWECTPGMSHHDTGLFKKGKRQFDTHETFHHANMRKMRTMIDDIMDDLPHVMGSESVCRAAKTILKMLYHSIHSEEQSDQKERMWHSPPNITATCILCAVIAFETRVGDSVFTVPRIVNAAQGYVPRKAKRRRFERRPRDVSVRTLFKYAKRMKYMKIVDIDIPKEIPIEWTMNACTNVKNEHARLAEFKKCIPVVIHMPHDKTWGMSFEEIPNFIQVDSVDPTKPAFKSGIIAGDYIIQINSNNILVDTKIDQVMAMILTAKKSGKNVTVTIMRKK